MIKLSFKTSKMPNKINKKRIPKVYPFLAVLVSLVLSGNILVTTLVQADQYDAQINALNAQNATNQADANQLGAQATSYQDQVSKLQLQINSLQTAINAAQAKVADLKVQIAKNEAELARQKNLLGTNIRQMYLEGQTSTLEMLASSKNLNDFVDKQEYRNSVQNKITTTLASITELKHQLTAQQQSLEQTINDQTKAEAQLADQQGQQNQLLAATQAQQGAINAQIQSNNAQIVALRAAQAAANRKIGGGGVVTAGDPGHGGYPAVWDNAYQDSLIDSWGMFNRECVSYTAWKVHQAYQAGRVSHDMPYWGGRGNANQWPADAQSDGIPSGSTPRANSVAISMGGAYGHAMWVESVNGNTIHVSQYNYDLQGHYSEMTINGSGLIYLYF